MERMTLKRMLDGLAAGEFSSEELTRASLERIQTANPALNAYITVTAEQALDEARASDRRRREGSAAALDGVPIAHKDIFCTRGVATTCGSRMLEPFEPPYDATVVSRLAAAGAVTTGKTNMDEFAMGSSNENSHFGAVKNPWDTGRVPGGSSGGSAAAVAAGLVPAATATDTGGSIRQPAALCGITGLKPTYGRVSRLGMVAFASSLDQGGVLARSAEDAAHLLGVMAGFDPGDSTAVDRTVDDYPARLERDIRGLRVGVPKEFFGEGLEAGVETPVRAALEALEAEGAELVDITLPHVHLSVPAYYIIAPAECSSNLARYDGVRYGRRCEDPRDLEDLYVRSRGEGFGAEVKRRIMVGTYALSAGYYDAYYRKAQQVRRLIADDFRKAFEQVDVLAGPTSPTTAFAIGERASDPVTMYLSDVNTIAVNLAGLPGMSVPCGFSDGLPVGLHLIGDYFDEAGLLGLAHRYQQMTDWHERIPKEFA
jgi:aspartyl-tRNA(Asn)/glutamyl-tRNA(Gln) amidotransferase subunit A